VASNSRRWWRNSKMLLNKALPISFFDELRVPRLAA
jgi:RNA-directed DNA polymerase